MDVANWLRALGLARYEAAFRENDVSAEVLCHLTADDLEGLGVAAIGHRRRLLVAIAKLRATAHRRCCPVTARSAARRPLDAARSLQLRANAASSP